MTRYHSVVQFEAVRSRAIPPAPGHTTVGGFAGSRNNLPGLHSSFQPSANCCDGVATRGFPSRYQLKSLRDKRWRRPLNHRNCRGWTDWLGQIVILRNERLAKVGQKGSRDRAPPRGRETGPPSRACKALFGNLLSWIKPSVWIPMLSFVCCREEPK
jgi:hypothetical protein